MNVTIPELSLVVLIGASGSGKSSFAARHFKPTEVLSSDYCRGLVADDPNSQAATKDAFDVLNFIAGKRLAGGRLTVVDATNVQPEARKPLVALAHEHDCLPVAIVLDLPEAVCVARNRNRPDRAFGPHVVRRQAEQLRRSLRSLKREGFRYVTVLSSQGEVEEVTIERVPSWVDRKADHGPFDIIGDVHGCFDELYALLERLGYRVEVGDDTATAQYRVTHPEGRKAVFLGDVVDRGPGVTKALRLAMGMVESGGALYVAGNHEAKLVRKLRGSDVEVTHGLEESLAQLEKEPPEFIQKVTAFLDGLISHYVLDSGKLVVAHAGVKEAYQGRASARVRDFCLFGETTGEIDGFGLPVRQNWAVDYRGDALVVYGHTPVVDPARLNRTVNIDTGCVFGGKLTALRYPEQEIVSVPAAREYYTPAKPFPALAATEGAPAGDLRPEYLLDIDDVMGKRVVGTRLRGNVTVREENAAAALEVMSRFAIDPRLLVYLPPTMAPVETSQRPDCLEYPSEAFSYYRQNGVRQVVCEEKHMGSRAVVIVAKDASVIARRFGMGGNEAGVCYTRTGRRFFEDPRLEAEFLGAVRAAFEAAGIWEELRTDWAVLDCELMPWSAKAQELIRGQYAAVGAAARHGLSALMPALERAEARGIDVAEVAAAYRGRLYLAERYVDAYRRYCWPVRGLADLRLAPFHLLATEGKVHTDREHTWHMAVATRLAEAAPGLVCATRHLVVDLDDPASENAATAWWEETTAGGGEGMVVKPLSFVTTGQRGLVQPAVKCRGAEYLRIIYGPEYTLPDNLERLRQRSLAAKRSLALREFALGVEGLERFVQREPLYRVHECAFAVLALESEPVDPRL
ncbi:MAG: polynucleotide kinase-phosphatase [Chloroflexi bacterium]|nr:polynucleotide kinase-phosphatase [Chloroflexota bacterium]